MKKINIWILTVQLKKRGGGWVGWKCTEIDLDDGPPLINQTTKKYWVTSSGRLDFTQLYPLIDAVALNCDGPIIVYLARLDFA